MVANAQDLGSELQQAFDLTEQQQRIEDFQDSVAGVLDNLAGIAIDHVFDGFFGAADEATTAIQTFTDLFRGDIELLENDVTRLARQIEDSKIRLLRLDEDESRRIRQLERQRRSLLARSSTGNQRDAERTRQRAQDISFRISALREDFDVRRSRTQEDADRRRNRAIDDAITRRTRFESRQTGESLPRQLLVTLGDSVADKISNALSGALAGLITGALQTPFQGLVDAIKGLFGGGEETQTTTATPGEPTGQDGQPQIQPEITAPTEPIAIKGKVDLSLMDINLPTEAVDLTGRIGTIEELSESVKLPPVPGLTGGIGRLVLPPGVDKPLVTGLAGEIMTVQLAEGLTLPTLPALRIPVIYDIPDLPDGRVDVGPLEVIGPPGEPTDETPAPATPALTGTLNIPIENITLPTESLILSAAIALMATDITPPVDAVDLQGAINLLSSDITTPLLPISLQGAIALMAADITVPTEPIALAGIINATVNTPALRDGMVEVGELEVLGPPDDTSPTTPTPSALQGVINAELNKTFTEPIALAGIINATVNTPDLPEGHGGNWTARGPWATGRTHTDLNRIPPRCYQRLTQ